MSRAKSKIVLFVGALTVFALLIFLWLHFRLPKGVDYESYDSYLHVTETRLSNGLTILTKEDHSAPIAYVAIYYKVGSRNEVGNEDGISHVVEHMMFQGTNDLPQGAIAYLLERNGAQFDASTNRDYTDFYEEMPANRVELAIRLEADRMEKSLFDPTTLKKEISVVSSEMDGDMNEPAYDLMHARLLPDAFRVHPYGRPTLGSPADVQALALNRDKVYRYYRAHYVPNNAIIIVAGDIDTGKVVSLCQRYFGKYPSARVESPTIPAEPAQVVERRSSLSKPASSSEVIIAYHAPPLEAKDHYAMDVIATILYNGRSSRLYQDLVDNGIAQTASASSGVGLDPYLFTLYGRARVGVDADALEMAMEREILRLQQEPLTTDELKKAKDHLTGYFNDENASLPYQARQIAMYWTLSGRDYLDHYVSRINAVTADDVLRVARTYLSVSKRTVAILNPLPLPAGATQVAADLSDEPGVRDHFTVSVGNASRQALAGIAQRFEGSERAQPPVWNRPQPARFVLPNGIVLIVAEDKSRRTIDYSGLLRAGSMYDPPGKWGLAELTGEMLSKGTRYQSADDIADALDGRDEPIDEYTNQETVNFSGYAFPDDLSTVLTILSNELEAPTFPDNELENLRGQMVSQIEDERGDAGGNSGPGSLANGAFYRSLYPQSSPLWIPPIDASIKAALGITVTDLQQFHATYYRPDTTILVLVGDITPSDAYKKVKDVFGDWPCPSTSPIGLPEHGGSLSKGRSVTEIPIENADETSLLWGFPGGLKVSDPDYSAAEVMNFILGGLFLNSRLNRSLRDEQGLCYSCNSDFDAHEEEEGGPFWVFLATKPEFVPRAVKGVEQIVSQMRERGATQDEVDEAKDYLSGTYQIYLSRNSAVAYELKEGEFYGLGPNHAQTIASSYTAVTLAQVNEAARKHLHPGDATLVIAGKLPAK